MTDTHDYEANETRIADYFDSKMSAAEEEAFMRELGNDEGLRQQYEEELLMRALLREHRSEGAVEVMLQPADEHLEMMEDALRKRGGGYFRWLAAACVFLLCGVLVWLVARRSHTTVVAPPDVASRPAVVDADSVFAHLYSVYTRGTHDPVQVSLYYQYYRDGKYKDVVVAQDADIAQMGTGDAAGAALYLHFYQGLSLLASQDAAGALARFEGVLKKAAVGSPVYAAAEWYSALAYVKNKEVGRAVELARPIVQTNSPYKQQAEALLQALTIGGSR